MRNTVIYFVFVFQTAIHAVDSTSSVLLLLPSYVCTRIYFFEGAPTHPCEVWLSFSLFCLVCILVLFYNRLILSFHPHSSSQVSEQISLQIFLGSSFISSSNMATRVGVGVFFIAAGPSLAIWLIMLQRRAHLLVVAILAAFTWLLAMMVAGTAWLAIPPLKQTFPVVLFVTVTLQEGFRFGLYSIFQLLSQRGDGVEAFIRPGAKNEILTGLSVGVGYALMSVLIQFYSVVADEFANDTAIYTDVCPLNFFVVAGSFSLAYSILHIFIGVFVWPAYSDGAGRWGMVAIAYVIRLGMSELSLSNRIENGCVWNIGVTWGLITITSFGIVLQARKRIREDRE